MCDGNCCSFPHGRISILTLLLALITSSLVSNASYGCYYVVINFSDSDNTRFQGLTSLGLLGYSTRDADDEFDYAYVCQFYSAALLDSFLDTAWHVARAMAILGNVASGIVALTSIVMSCMSVSQSVIRILIFLLVITSLAEAFTFLVFASDICRDYGCRLSVSARLTIASSIMAFVTAIVFARIQPVSNSYNNYPSSYIVGEAPGTVTIEETVHPDGTKTIVKTTANADGSKTVEETVERHVSHDAYAMTTAVTNTKEEQVIARPTVVTY